MPSAVQRQSLITAPTTTSAMPPVADKIKAVPGKSSVRVPANDRNTSVRGTAASNIIPAIMIASERVFRDERCALPLLLKSILQACIISLALIIAYAAMGVNRTIYIGQGCVKVDLKGAKSSCHSEQS